MTLADLVQAIGNVPPQLQSRVPVFFRVGPLPQETTAGDKLPIAVEFDADGSFVIEVCREFQQIRKLAREGR